MYTGSAVIAGVGPGLGAALARRFAAGGLNVVMGARKQEHLEALTQEINDHGGVARAIACDVTRENDVRALCELGERDFGGIRAAVFNAGAFVPRKLLDTDPSEFEHCWRVGCFGGFLVGQQAARHMRPRGAGSILFTGATAGLRGGAGFANLAVPKFGLRALSQSLARELGPAGLHVAHVVVDGQIDTSGAGDTADETRLAPSAIAESFWFLHQQPRSAWTQELDLRPYSERF